MKTIYESGRNESTITKISNQSNEEEEVKEVTKKLWLMRLKKQKAEDVNVNKLISRLDKINFSLESILNTSKQIIFMRETDN